MSKKKKKYSTKYTKEEYEKLTGQRLGQLTGQGTSVIIRS